MPMDEVIRGIVLARGELSPDGDAGFWAAMATTDAFEKRLSLDVALPSGGVRISAQAKGAGMLQPSFATMLCFVQTDAVLQAETADLLLGVCVKRSFDRISVDGQLSTNDTAMLHGLGRERRDRRAGERGRAALGEALDYVHRRLALQMVRDGEGAERIGRVHVHGGDPSRSSTRPARSPTCRSSRPRCTAATRTGAGWRRPSAAPAGRGAAARGRLDRGRPGVRGGMAVRHDARALAAAVGEEVEYHVGLPGEGAETEVFFSDLSYDYIRVNAEYTT